MIYRVALDRLLLQRGYEVTLLLRRRSPAAAHLLVTRGANAVNCDLLDAGSYQAALTGGDVCSILPPRIRSIAGTSATASAISPSLSSCGDRPRIPTIIYTSSVVVMGRSADPRRPRSLGDRVEKPESPYVHGKLAAEQWVEQRISDGIDIRRIYPSWVAGAGDPGLTPPHKFIRDVLAKGQPFYFDGGVSIAHVEDVALGHVLAFEQGQVRGQYILSGEDVTFAGLYSRIAHIWREGAAMEGAQTDDAVGGPAVGNGEPGIRGLCRRRGWKVLLVR